MNSEAKVHADRSTHADRFAQAIHAARSPHAVIANITEQSYIAHRTYGTF